MDNRKIESQVCEKVMGWQVTYYQNIDVYEAFDEDGDQIIIGKNFSPAAKIQDAWIVVEKLREYRYFTLSDCLDEENNKKVYYANFQYNDSYQLKNNDAFSNSAPMAICLAALKTVGFEVPTK